MRSGVSVLLWITITGYVDVSIFADQCAFFTDLNHETVANRTANLTFKIANSCANHNVERVWTFVKKPFGNSITCLFLLSSRICTSLSEEHARCSCDADHSTFSVSRVLEGDQETWMLEGHVSNGRVFEFEHQVWADQLAEVTLPNDFTSSNTAFLESGFIYSFQIALILSASHGVLFLIVVLTCVLYCKAKRTNTQARQGETIELQSMDFTAPPPQQSRDAPPEAGDRISDVYQEIPERVRQSCGDRLHIHNQIPDSRLQSRDASGDVTAGGSQAYQVIPESPGYMDMSGNRQQPRVAQGEVTARDSPAYQNVPGPSGYMEMRPSLGHDHKEIPSADDGGDVLPDGARHAGTSSAEATSDMESSYMLRPLYRKENSEAVLPDGATHAGTSSAAATSGMELSYIILPVYRRVRQSIALD